MRAETYFGTHMHTSLSNIGSGGLDCLVKLPDLIERAKELGMNGVTITNHDNLSEMMDINKMQKKAQAEHGDDFKIAYGNEIYLIKDYENNPETGKPLRQRYYHFILIAKDKIGFDAMVELSSRAWYRSEVRYNRRRVPTFYKDLEEVMRWAKGHLIGTSACFPAGTLVKTENGEKPIEEIKEGDKVYSYQGWSEVAFPTKREYSGDIYKLEASHSFFDELMATEDHKIAFIPRGKGGPGLSERETQWCPDTLPLDFQDYFSTCNKSKRRMIKQYCRWAPEPLWAQIKDLQKDDYLLIPIIFPEKEEEKIFKWDYERGVNQHLSIQKKGQITLDSDFCELFGIWLAEGGWDLRKNGLSKISFTIHQKEEQLKKRIIYLVKKSFPTSSPSFHVRKDSLAQTISFNSIEIASCWSALYEEPDSSKINQWNKKIPKVFETLPSSSLLQIVKGWLMGDGYYRKRERGQEFVGATVSKELAQGLLSIYHRNFINPSLSVSKAHTGKDGTNHKESYYISIAGKVAGRIQESILGNKTLAFEISDRLGKDLPFCIGDKLFLPSKIKKVEKVDKKVEEVYCLNVPNGHSFTTHNIIVHNCLGGFSPQAVLNGDPDSAVEFINWCTNLFGVDDFYIELQPQVSKEQIKWNKTARELFSGTHKFLIATDSHFLREEDFPMLEAFLRSQQENRDVQEFYEYARMMSVDEIYKFMDYFDDDFITEALNNTTEIQRQIEFFDLEQKFHIPKVKVPHLEPKYEYDLPQGEYKSIERLLSSNDEQTRYCIITCLDTLKERDRWKEEYLKYLDEELDVFIYQSEELNDNFFAYFNTMRHYINLAWEVGCPSGPSRGSASGSMICYLMDIVQGDPVQNGYYLWRFANKVRASVLDIDTDFTPSRRDVLFQAIREERGELGLTQVATFKKLTLKAAIGNAGRGYRSKDFPEGIPPDIIAYLSSLIEVKRGFVASLKQTKEGDDNMGFNINHAFLKEVEKYPGLLDIIEKFEGVIVNNSTHAAAVVLFDEKDTLTNHTSLMRSPNGDISTALDLHKAEDCGIIKFDFLLLSTLDIMTACFELLQKDKVIDPSLSLRECFKKYIDPNKIDYSNPDIWEALYNDEVLSVFQFDQASGRRGVLATKPQSLEEMTAVNALIRLMTPEGGEDQIERFVRIKNNPQAFEEEMIEKGVSKEYRDILHEVLDRYNGCCVMQENFMELSQKLVGYTLRDADSLRKLVAKKDMSAIDTEKEKYFEFGRNKGLKESHIEYFWNLTIVPSLGYGFSKNHSHPYSIIGVQCILLGKILFPPIYWQTACLLQRSGALDGKTTDHNKIAKAVSQLTARGINIQPISINSSEMDFSLDAEKNIIYYGFAAIKGVKKKVIDAIIENRPFTSMQDFLAKTKADITSTIALIKCGAFDEFGSRKEHVEMISTLKADLKQKINGQNLLMISRDGYWPQTSDELIQSQKVFNFTQYLKKINKDSEDKENYFLDDRSCEFLDRIGYKHNAESFSKTEWKSFYDFHMGPIKKWIAENQEEILDLVNQSNYDKWVQKYFPKYDEPQWEIETMGVTFKEHPHKHVTASIVNFDDLPIEPEIANIFRTKEGRSIPLYKLCMISGIVVAKDKLHSSITLLTPSGPVEVKFRKEQFAHYDAQISKQVNGKRQVVETSWFRRGVGLIIHGMRQDDLFVAKTYKNSPMKHTAYKILDIKPDNKFEVQKERKKGVQEEDEDNE